MSHRSILSAVPAAAAVTEETPVEALFREWRACHVWANDALSSDDTEFNSRCDVRAEIEARLYAAPARSERDLLLKFMALWLDGSEYNDDTYGTGDRLVAEARSMIGAGAYNGTTGL